MRPILNEAQLDETLAMLFAQHVGAARQIERWELVRQVFGAEAVEPMTDDNLHDRAIRNAVMRLRLGGALIVDLHRGSGRFLAADMQEYLKFRTFYLEPLRTRADVIKAMDKAARERFDCGLQPALFDMTVFRVLE